MKDETREKTHTSCKGAITSKGKICTDKDSSRVLTGSITNYQSTKIAGAKYSESKKVVIKEATPTKKELVRLFYANFFCPIKSTPIKSTNTGSHTTFLGIAFSLVKETLPFEARKTQGY